MFQIITHLIIYLLVYKLSKQNTFLSVNIRKKHKFNRCSISYGNYTLEGGCPKNTLEAGCPKRYTLLV